MAGEVNMWKFDTLDGRVRLINIGGKIEAKQ